MPSSNTSRKNTGSSRFSPAGLTKNYWPVLVPQDDHYVTGAEQKIKIIKGADIDNEYRLIAESVSL